MGCRSFTLALCVLAVGCGDSKRYGASITLEGVAASTTRIDVVLTTLDGTSGPQRVDEATPSPTALPADYYSQRAFGGSFYGDTLTARGGSPVVLIEANSDADTSAVIPFVIGYDGSDQPTQIGTYGSAAPEAISIVADQLTSYAINIVATTPQTLGSDFAANEAALVSCGSGSATVTSGLVWQPAAFGGTTTLPDEIRVMFALGSATDATTTRTAYDLDCDGATAAAPTAVTGSGDVTQDCDDLEPDTYRGAPEVCDGRNEDCSGASHWGSACTPDTTMYKFMCVAADGSSTPLTGFQECDDATAGGELSACAPDALCACSAGIGVSLGCRKCAFEMSTQGACLPAQTSPALAMPAGCTTGCVPFAFGATNDWIVQATAADSGQSVVFELTAGSGTNGSAAGEFYVAIFGGTPIVQVFGYDIVAMPTEADATCTPIAVDSTIDELSCSSLSE